ncbi:hypothetical protein VTJ49DRAFT_3119 [Mycothermus thermophilus]|uniref:Uncharacterized protein n=1 Tax=Humicola insolens TaxID=85995 RepID=A0ABR3V8F0_HUMIN
MPMLTSSPIRYPSSSDEEVIQWRREVAQLAAMLVDSSESSNSASDSESDDDIPATGAAKHKRALSVSGITVAGSVPNSPMSVQNDGVADSGSGEDTNESDDDDVPELCFGRPVTPDSSDDEGLVRNRPVSPVIGMDNDMEIRGEEGADADVNLMDIPMTSRSPETEAGEVKTGALQHVLDVLRLQDSELCDLKMAVERIRREEVADVEKKGIN